VKVRVADFIADFFVKHNIDTVFTVTGGGAMHLNDAFGHKKEMNCIYNHHEQACSMGAEGYTRLSGKTALVCVTSGPGGTNTLTGVMGAWLDSIPMIVISGQMKYVTTIASTEVPLRQLGFQEFNIIDAVKCMTKYAVMVTDANKILYHLEEALYISENGRPGPVWLDIPLDIQGEKIETEDLEHYQTDGKDAGVPPHVSETQINKILEKVLCAKRPVILAGNGIRIGHAEKKFLKVAEKLNIPVVTAWNAHDLIDDEHPLYAGRPGTIGTRGGNFVVQNSDLLISFGCRMSIRQISYAWENFAKYAYKIAVDIDYSELIKPTLNIDYPVHADIADVFDRIIASEYESDGVHDDWILWCKNVNQKYPVVIDKYRNNKKFINPYVFMEKLSEQLNEEDAIVASNGTACVCSFQAIKLKEGERMFTNAGASSMGYGLPAAIGASISSPDKRIICLEGDGSIQMNLQELQTLVHHHLNVKVFWLNNDGYHSIRQTQFSSFDANARGYCGVNGKSGISFPSAEKIAYAYGMKYILINSHEKLEGLLESALNGDEPVLCEVILDKEQFFEPKLSSKVHPDGTITSPSLEDMFPFLDEKEMASNMPAWGENNNEIKHR